MLFRLLLLSVVTLTSLVWLPVYDASAQNGAWCARRQGSMSCGYATFQQCMATVLGDGGICVQNPAGGARGAAGPAGGGANPAAAAAKKAAAEREARAERAREAAEERRRAKQKEDLARRQRAKQQEAAKPAPAAAPQPAAPAPAAPVPASAVSGSVPLADLDVNAVPALNRDAIRRVQTVLKEKGFDPGPLNGVATPRTQAAVQAFQTRYGIEARGTIDNQTLLALGEAGLASPGGR
jgi:pyruvate/2-oxoglutarate dehydrogenase complex dihydrolipoamide acyltransferase (E2) component